MRNPETILKFRKLDDRIAAFSDSITRKKGDDEFDFVPNISLKGKLYDMNESLLNEVESIEKPDAVFEILADHFKDFTVRKRLGIKGMFERPSHYVQGFVYSYTYFASQDSREDAVRAEKATKSLTFANEVIAGLRTWLSEVSSVYLQELVYTCDNSIETFEFEVKRLNEYFSVSDALKAELVSAIHNLCRNISEFKDEARNILAKYGMVPQGLTADSDCVGMLEGEYRSLLFDGLGVKLDELLRWHEDEIRKTRSEVFEIASRLNIPENNPKTMSDANNILLKYAGPASSPEEMFARGNAYIKRTHEACREFCYLPEGENCRIVTVPEQLKLSYPWGGYGGGDSKRKPLLGEMFLNNHNFKAVTDGWIKINTVHEAYPGHHVQFLRTTVDEIPETFKRGAKHEPITEGTPIRSERMFEFVFPEDPFYPLFVAYRRHHTAVRIKADLYLRYFNRPIKDSVELYMEELGFDRNTARGQVQAQENMQGYFTTYYYGMKTLEDLEKKFGFEKKAYTEMLFSAGRVSLETFEKILKLSAEDRNSLFKDFKSIEQFGE